MSLKPNNDDVYCFVPCDMEKVTRGGCACYNRVSNSYTKDAFAIGSLSPEKDWKEDFVYENGNYFNTCAFCSSLFVGHKSRVVCKICSFEKAKLSNQKHEIDIKMFGKFLMDKVMDAYKNHYNIELVIEDEFEIYKKEYLKNGSKTN